MTSFDHGVPSGPLVRVGVFTKVFAADDAIRRLIEAGFENSQILVVAPKSIKDHFDEFNAKLPGGSLAVKAAATGGTIGAILGGVLAATTVIASGGALFVVAGPLLAAAAGGAASGGFIGAMLSRGLENDAASYYDQALKKGKILVGVEYDGADRDAKLALAEKVLAGAGAEPIPLEAG